MKTRIGNWLTIAASNPWLITALVALTIVLGASGTIFWVISIDNRHDREYLQYAGDLRVLSQEISKTATESANGAEDAFALLQNARSQFQEKWDFVRNGNNETGLPGIDPTAIEVASLESEWIGIKAKADYILDRKREVIDLTRLADAISDDVPPIQRINDNLLRVMLLNGVESSVVAAVQRQSLLAERLVRNINKILIGGESAEIAANALQRDADLFGRTLATLGDEGSRMSLGDLISGEAGGYLDDIEEIFVRIEASVGEVLALSEEIFEVRSRASAIFVDSDRLLGQVTQLVAAIEDESNSRFFSDTLLIGVVLFAIGLIILIAYLFYRDTKLDLERTAEQNEANQAAILRLLDELADLADGDLTTQATVTEDFTGAIADSINFAIDQMRQLVSAINATAVQVSSAAQETQATAMHLAEASEHQAQEIAGASAAVNEMAVSIDQVSANAAESSAVAERSVTIAKKGADVVQATINGMDNIREQIQETGKRIKRLGESSQEIGDIVSLINDIADQTNILALNAAIQASMAGDAGRGFAVVADEVQRLAERSSAATKQIEALVKTIQSDTNEAVISMEQTVSEVVRGARLAQDAGVALEEIETVSKSLADLIQNISNAARQQASSAGHISNTMNVIQEITSQTTAGTTATAKSIGNLAQLANEMRASVAGFKLPDGDEMDFQELLPEADQL